MPNFEPLRFHFHASGYALSGHFHRPVDVPISAQAALALPIEGGQAHSGIENFAIPRLAAFDAAQTHLSGSFQDDDTTTTSVTVVVDALSILDFLTVDRMVTRLTSEYKFNQKNSENHIIALGSHFDGLKLGGYEVNVTLRHDLLLESKTYADLKKSVKDDKKSGKIVLLNDTHEVLLCSLVEKIETDLPGAVVEGHTITVPHFGKIALAEVFAGRNIRTLTMLRFTLGSPDGGSGSGGSGTGNGQPPSTGN
jgi:hypothetical protein